ncbi:MAG: hypothetical protein QM763_02125 [Agriterribacter sp.]
MTDITHLSKTNSNLAANSEMKHQQNDKSVRTVIWLSRILRWAFGILFITIGILYLRHDGWPAIIFGVAMIVTGFFCPKRCINDSCNLSAGQRK